MLKVSEIFCSIDGEGIRAGCPTVFLRLYGCNLACSYCDSKYACKGNDYTSMSVNDICNKILSYGILNCTITGGEPLLESNQDELIKVINILVDKLVWVNIETNGSIDLKSFDNKLDPYDSGYEEGVIYTMDWKSISSGMTNKMLDSNLDFLRCQDVLKFVVGSKEDLDQMRDLLYDFYGLDPCIFVSPVFGKIDPKDIVNYLIINHLSNVRLQLQLHKLIWDPNMKGV